MPIYIYNTYVRTYTTGKTLNRNIWNIVCVCVCVCVRERERERERER